MRSVRVVADTFDSTNGASRIEKTLEPASFGHGSFPPAQLELALNALLDLLEQAKESAAGDGLQTFCPQVEIFDGDELVDTLDDDAFFARAVRHDLLEARVLEYCQASGEGAYGSRIWRDDETPAGTGAILALVAKDKAWVAEYVEFLRTSDLDHEVDQYGDIAQIVEQYGWCDETLRLATARAVSCCGQFGQDQVERWLDEEELSEQGLGNFLADEAHAEALVQALVDEFRYVSASGSYEYMLRRCPRRQYVDTMLTHWADVFADVLATERLAAELQRLWDEAQVESTQ